SSVYIVKYVDTWDLEDIFPGGTQSKKLKEKLEMIKGEIKEYKQLLEDSTLQEGEITVDTLKSTLKKQESIKKGMGQARTFVQMWHDAYMDDEHASVAMGKLWVYIVMYVNSPINSQKYLSLFPTICGINY